ncbi:hypothetical protein FN846DRAFT_808545, partial [Sphaerosporella brunnea]
PSPSPPPPLSSLPPTGWIYGTSRKPSSPSPVTDFVFLLFFCFFATRLQTATRR